MGLAHDLAAKNTSIVRQELGSGTVLWKVRRLTPTQMGRAPHALNATILRLTRNPAMAEADEDADESFIPSEEDIATLNVNIERIVGLAVVALSTDGETWEPVSLVQPDQEDPDKGLISFATMDSPTSLLITRAALQGADAGGERIRPFRPGRVESGPPARQGRKKVRKASPRAARPVVG